MPKRSALAVDEAAAGAGLENRSARRSAEDVSGLALEAAMGSVLMAGGREELRLGSDPTGYSYIRL